MAAVKQAVLGCAPAIDGGLRLPIVYNTSSYDSPDSLRLMDGIVDIYLPDLKVVTPAHARRYLRMPGYPQVARETVKEMNRQVGPLRFGRPGLARRGLLVRHLMMPGMLEETKAILRFVAADLGPGTYVDLMAQYYPAGLVGSNQRDSYAEIDRRLAREEYQRAVTFAAELGLERLDQRQPGIGPAAPRGTGPSPGLTGRPAANRNSGCPVQTPTGSRGSIRWVIFNHHLGPRAHIDHSDAAPWPRRPGSLAPNRRKCALRSCREAITQRGRSDSAPGSRAPITSE